MTKIDDVLMFFCVSGFFVGVVVAVTTLPIWAARAPWTQRGRSATNRHC